MPGSSSTSHFCQVMPCYPREFHRLAALTRLDGCPATFGWLAAPKRVASHLSVAVFGCSGTFTYPFGPFSGHTPGLVYSTCRTDLCGFFRDMPGTLGLVSGSASLRPS